MCTSRGLQYLSSACFQKVSDANKLRTQLVTLVQYFKGFSVIKQRMLSEGE